MKTIKFGIIICAAMVSMTACKKGGVFCHKANGNVVTEERSHTDFTDISVELAADLYIEQSTDYSVKIEASDNLQEIIETKVKGSTLEIDLKKGKCIKNNHEIKVYVTLPTLNGVAISGSGDVYIPNKLESDNLDISISGSGNLWLDSLDVNNLETSISGSGDFYLAGVDTAYSQEISISGSGEIHSFDMPVKHSDIRISGSGECEVNATETLKVNISGSGDIIYKGNPIVDQNISGSGSVKHF